MPVADSWRDLVDDFSDPNTAEQRSESATPRRMTSEERVSAIVVLFLLTLLVVVAGWVSWLHPWSSAAH